MNSHSLLCDPYKWITTSLKFVGVPFWGFFCIEVGGTLRQTSVVVVYRVQRGYTVLVWVVQKNISVWYDLKQYQSYTSTGLVWNLRYTTFIPAIYQAKISFGPNTSTWLVWKFLKCAWYHYVPGIKKKRKKNPETRTSLVYSKVDTSTTLVPTSVFFRNFYL
jgi:hypothetical protein